jgi:hypothetical protein
MGVKTILPRPFLFGEVFDLSSTDMLGLTYRDPSEDSQWFSGIDGCGERRRHPRPSEQCNR